MLSRGQVERIEREVNALHARVRETWAARGKSPKHRLEWQRATEAFHSYRNPVDYLWESQNLALVRRGDRDALESALAFLEADAHFYRSGYLKEKVLHAIKRAPWERNDEVHLMEIVLRAIEGRHKREIKYYSRLIPRLRTEPFEADLRAAVRRSESHNHKRMVKMALDSHL